MRYSYKFKRTCVDLYQKGSWPPTPEGLNTRQFHKMIRKWFRMEEAQGPEVLRPKRHHKLWTPEEKMELVSCVLAGKSCKSTALEAGINKGMLYQWVQKYNIFGYNGLVRKKQGRKPKEGTKMKHKTQSAPLTESEREELIRLRAENEYIKTEIAVIKKEIALREEKNAAQLKAKKQRWYKTSGKQDTN